MIDSRLTIFGIATALLLTLTQPNLTYAFDCQSSLELSLGLRVSLLKNIEKKQFNIQGVTYSSTKQLGRSTSIVYLGESPVHKQVSIKDYSHYDEINSELRAAIEQIIDLEVLETRYLIENGVDLPGIISFDLEKLQLVKEYEEGLTLLEIKKHKERLGLDDLDFKRLSDLRDSEILRLAKISEGFHKWLIKNNQDAKWAKSVFWRVRFPNLEMGGSNLIYSFSKQKWILIDL